jgi:hypothetical protein
MPRPLSNPHLVRPLQLPMKVWPDQLDFDTRRHECDIRRQSSHPPPDLPPVFVPRSMLVAPDDFGPMG